jgi:hypothetical protein
MPAVSALLAGMFQLTMHPHITGPRSRMVILEELIEYIAGQQGVRWATHAEIARYVLEAA